MQPHRRIARRVCCACVAGTICLFVTGAVVGGRARAQTTTRVSVATGSRQSSGEAWLSALSADGRYVAFESDAPDLVPGDTNAAADVFVHDRQTGGTALVSVSTGGAEGDADSMEPSLSADGRFVAFSSYAHDLVADDRNGVSDIFVRDRQTAVTTRVSVATGGVEAKGHSFSPSMSADGRHVSFWSAASNLVADDTNGAASALAPRPPME
jgi:Tol biopolymer transport system component